jgi:GH43 family beta-xylosidase
MFDLGYATIDGSVLRCDEGNFFYYSRDCCENYVDGIKTSQLYCVRMNDDLTEVVGEHKLVSTPTEDFEKKSLALEKVRLWNEGPCVIKLGDKYVMNYSANYYASNDYAICVSTADSPMGPWVKSKNNPVLSCRKELFGAGHNAFFTGKDGEIYTSFHIQTDPAHPSGDRRTVIGKVSFSERNGEIFEEIE